MDDCSRFHESLLLEVHGENVEDPAGWEAHLASCARCREKRMSLLRMLGKLEKAWRLDQPTAEESLRLQRSIWRRLRREPEAGGPRRLLPLRFPMPALAGVLALVLAVGWFGWQQLRPPTRETNGFDVEDRLLAQDKDLLEEMDLLEDMDVIQRLVQLLDKREPVL